MQGTQAEKGEVLGSLVESFLAKAQEMENAGKWAEAISYYEKVRQMEPRKALHCARHLAVLYDRQEDFDKALDEYGVLLRANPKDAVAYNDRGYGYYRRGKFDAAEQNLRKATELDPKNTLAWSNLGMALAQLNRYDESLSAFEKSTQRNGMPVTRPQALCNVAFIQASQGKWIEARDSYALALKEEPGMQKARIALQRINEEMSASKSKDRADNKRRVRDLERPTSVVPEIAGGLPFGAPNGMVGADAGMIVISRDATPIELPMPAGSFAPGTNARTQPPAAPTPVPQAAAQLPPIPSTLEVD
jgi:tetratricopeptide (TPR) repeat protein